jgi:hypothetical protein
MPVLLICSLPVGADPVQPGLRRQGAVSAGVNVTTFHGDESRLGWNAAETRLTPANVHTGSFGKLWAAHLDSPVPGSPLYVSGLTVAEQRHDVVYAATVNDSVYAVDAATGKVLWATKHLREPVTEAQFTGSWFGRGGHGILSTPVIDPASGTLYTCLIRAKGLRQLYEVWALDILTGAVRPGWPVTLKGEYAGVRFEAGQVMQRGALSLIDGWVYVPFGGRGDTPPWRGWLVGVDSQHPEAPQRAFCTSPKTDGAGIWSGGGVAYDGHGGLIVTTGNGDYDFAKGGDNLSQSIVRLTLHDGKFGFTKDPRDFYTPANYKYLDDQDEDLGGATALILPDQPNTSTPHLIFTGGKDGLAYLVDRDNLGGIGGELQKIRLFGDPNAVYHEGIRATSAYFDAGDAGRFVYIPGDPPGTDGNLGMTAMLLAPDEPNGPMRMKRAWTLTEPLDGPTAALVSSNGGRDGIVWVVECADGDHSDLRAYDALTGAKLYNSNEAPESDHFTGGRRFTSPIVANGRVFVNSDDLVCFGLLTDGPAK